jgi:lactose/L-arabinose transport system substrate-binding protein
VTALQAQTNLPSITLIRSQVLKNVARNGGMLNLDDFMAENGDVLFPVAKTRNPVDGHWYSFPNDLGPYALMYNADMFEEAGLPTDRETLEEEIQTWDDFIEAGEQFKRDTGNDLITFQTSSAANGLPRAMMTQAGGAYYNDDGEFQFDQEANVRAMEKLQEMNDRINTSIQWLSSQFWDAFRKENVAVMAGAAWMVGFTKQNLPDMEGKWRVMRMPSLGGDTPRAANFGGVGAGIPLAVDSNEQEAAKEFGKYWHLSEDSFNVKLDLGVFPAHYIEGAEQATATDPYFGGQNRNEVFIQSAQDCPPQYPHPNPRALELGRESYRLILQEGEDVAETLTSINEQMLEAIPEEEKTTGGTSG